MRYIIVLILLAFSPMQASDPWNSSQLMEPAELARTINNIQAPQPVIYCVGPGAVIKGSINIGPAKDSINLSRLRNKLEKLPRDASVVIYCGCCPFANCPNVRPAFSLLNNLKFQHAKLLNLEHNIRVDWISKGYPQN